LRTRRWRRQSRANPSLKRGFSPEPSKTRFRWVLDVTNSERRRFASNSPETRTAFPGGRPHYSILFPSIRGRARARPTTENPLLRAGPPNSSRKRNSRCRAKIRFRFPVRFG
jgi:hypothetical protein